MSEFQDELRAFVERCKEADQHPPNWRVCDSGPCREYQSPTCFRDGGAGFCAWRFTVGDGDGAPGNQLVAYGFESLQDAEQYVADAVKKWIVRNSEWKRDLS